MPFEEGNTVGNRFSSENQPVSNGRPVGVKNRSTIAKQILALQAKPDELVMAKINELHPEIMDRLTTEEVATIMIAGQAMLGDVNAYKAIMDSAYGAPKQEIEQHNLNTNVLSNDPLSDAASDDSPAQN
jgi:hypothetical protein